MVREIVEEPQWAIITGGNSAFGRAAATALGRAGFNIFISCRSTVVCANTINQLKPKVGHGVHVEGLELDLTDFGSIRRFADGVKRKRLLVKVLIHCAGVFCPADGSATKEGVDLAFAVNYIGPFLLTQLLIPELYRARPARIISITNSCYASAHQVDLMHVRNMATKLDLRGQLRVTVHFGKNLEFRSKEPNSFVRVKLMDDKFTTETMKKTANPTYNHLMVFKTENMNEVVHFEVVHLDKNGEEHIIGQAKVHLWELQSDMDALVYNFEKTINLAGDEAKDVHLQATGKEDTLRAKLLSHDKYTLTEDFNLLDESKRQTRSATGKASKGVPSAHTVDLKAKDFKERISQFNDVELNEKANTISFIVRKRLNMFKTSHRRIVLDLHNKVRT